jgi:hypothetical protein
VAGVEEGEVVVRVGDVYVVGGDDWFVVPVDAVEGFLAKLLSVGEEEVSLEC